MREIYKTYSQKGKKQVKSTTISVALLVVATLIFSSALPVMAIQTHTTTLNVKAPDEIISNGLAPRGKTGVSEAPDLASAPEPATLPIDSCEYMYGYNAYPGPEETFRFPIADPSEYEKVGDTISGDFLAGGTYGCDFIWYAVQYGNGILYGIDPYSGDMWSIGGGGTGMNGLAYNPVDNRMYGSSDSNYLYEIDPDTGDQDQIGPFGSGVQYMIGMAFDSDGILYGWDLGQDSLWTIDTDTGEATKVGSLGISINFAQDGDFCRETDTLYLTAYVSTGQLYECDEDTGQCTLIGTIGSGIETTASIFLNSCKPIEHDISLRAIVSPQSGRAEPDMDMTILVKNTGNNTETFDAQMEIIKCEAGPLIYEEYFDDGVLPDGWDTDYWTIQNTDNAGGTAPEARVYYYDQYYGGQYYDNYIVSNFTDCTGLEKVNLRFRWQGVYGSPQYASVYVKFRRNSTSPWKDVTPWDNPVGSNQDADLWEIGCYGFGEPMGEEFQMMWQYIGYWSYFRYLYLDDVTLEACGGCAEYAELREDITLQKEEEIEISFPGWTPSEWQNETSENTWEEYPVHAFIICEEDLNPRNDEKWLLMDLWYPWMHDVEVMSIDSPHEEGRSMPAQTFPVQATMQNVGQYPECCIPIDISIGNSFNVGQPLYEEDWDNTGWTYSPSYWPGLGSGWTDEHKVFAYYYGWRYYNGANSGGSPPEAQMYYYYTRQDYVFYSAALDTSDFVGNTMSLNFLSYIYAWGNFGLYAFEAGYSYDAETWYAAWHEEPEATGTYEVSVPIVCQGDTMYIGFWLKGLNSGWYYWYVDNVELVVKGFTEEFSDFACQGPDLEPGEEATFVFEDWTPAFLAEETTGQKVYVTECFITMEGDKNPANDVKIEEFVLDYWHDVGIDRITSPVGEGHPRLDELVWDNGEPDGVNGLFFGQYIGYDNWLIDDFEITQKKNINGLKLNYVWGPGYGENLKSMWICIVEETGDCKPDPADPPYYLVECTDFVEYTTGQMYFSRPEVIAECEFDGVTLQPGTWWIGAMPVGTIDAYAYWLTATMQNCVGQWHAEYFGYPRWSPVSNYGYNYNFAWSVYGGGGPPKIKAWIKPGTEDIDAVVKNYGTFTKEDLTAYAQIREFMSDPENGTEVYTDEIGNIDLMDPLGGEKNLQFSDFTFADEGKYGLYIQLPTDPDDVYKNNEMKYGVAVDDTRPYCDDEPILDPSEPDGCEGWYVNDVTVTLNATDPYSNGVSSGVKEIRYTINGGAEQIIPGKTGSFLIIEDGEDILVEYWCIDWVGNVEASKNSFTIDMDQTSPEVELTYEVTSGNPIQGWEFTFTATANDVMSGMERVEFLFNGVLQETVTGPGPTYSWTLKYWPIPKATFTAVAYDIACNFASDDVIDPVTSSHSTPAPKQQNSELPLAKPLPR